MFQPVCICFIAVVWAGLFIYSRFTDGWVGRASRQKFMDRRSLVRSRG